MTWSQNLNLFLSGLLLGHSGCNVCRDLMLERFTVNEVNELSCHRHTDVFSSIGGRATHVGNTVYVGESAKRIIESRRLLAEYVENESHLGSLLYNLDHLLLSDDSASCGVDEYCILLHHLEVLTTEPATGLLVEGSVE